MITLAKAIWITVLTALVAGLSGTPLQAQQRNFGFMPQRNLIAGPLGYTGPPINPNWLVAPGLSLNQAAYNLAVAGQAYSYIPPYLLGYNPYALTTGYGKSSYSNGYLSSPYTSAYGNTDANPYAYLYANSGGIYGGYAGATGYGTGGYGTGSPSAYSSYNDPYSGFLRGSGDVIRSQGKLVLELEQAKQTHEKARQARIETRRKLFDEIMYERAHTPTFTELREKAIADNLRRSQNSAPVTEIWSAKALNDILADLKKLHGKNVREPRIELDAQTLRQINVVAAGSGNIGLLRNEGRLTWPLGLRDLQPADDSKDVRKSLDADAIEAVSQATSGKVNPGTIKDLQANVNKLHRLLARNVNEVPTNAYIEAKRFLNNLDDAIRALQDPNVNNYFNNTKGGGRFENKKARRRPPGLLPIPVGQGQRAMSYSTGECVQSSGHTTRPGTAARSTKKPWQIALARPCRPEQPNRHPSPNSQPSAAVTARHCFV
jgi:hypothetical protein